MRIARTILMIGLGLGVTACTAVDVPTRNTPFEQLPDSEVVTPSGYVAQTQAPVSEAPATAADPLASLVPGQSPVSVNSVVVRVPRTLEVSEANRYLPKGDIVWREDPIGDRHAQVQAIVQDAVSKGVQSLNGPATVDLDIQVTRFHALTEKARYTTGGVHSISFYLAVRDPKTGALLMPVRMVRADLDAFGGQQAINAEARGQTQKVRITDHLAEVIRQEMSNPEGYKNADLGFIQMLNNI
jgi:uncharacterized protein DUF6778